jgi:hypothetical protein
MPLVLPYKSKTPWWAWLTGGVGLASAGVSIALAVTADPKRSEPCDISGPDPSSCVDRGRDTDLALLLGVTAAPLLTIPLVFLLRKSGKKTVTSLEPGLSATAQGGLFHVRGAF